MTRPRGIIYTFYSFKGGVGRSMALANVAALMAKASYKVLIIDWDLEAPGLEKYFTASPSFLSQTRDQRPGVVDIVHGYSTGQRLLWKDCIIQASPFSEGLPVSILTGGRDSPEYLERLQNISWQKLFGEMDFGNYLEKLREEWVEEFDFVLVDSRTGITDIGGICTIHLPDIIILMFTTNEQSINGIRDVIDRVFEKYKTLPLDRSKLLAVPVPSRFETVTENNLSYKWKGIIASTFQDIYEAWIPDKTTPAVILEKLIIPYIAFWSFGEGLPVVTEGTGNPSSLGFAYELLARLLINRLKWNESLAGGIVFSSEASPELFNYNLDATFNQFDEAERATARRIILRLVSFDPTNSDNDFPKKVGKNDFTEPERQVIEQLVKRRVLLQLESSLTKDPTFELSQKNTLKNWKQLKAWIEEDREFLLWRQDLHTRAVAWEDNGRHRSELLHGGALQKAKRQLEKRELDFNIADLQYIHKSISQSRSDKALRIMVGIVIVLTMIAIVFVILLENSNKRHLQVTNDSLRVQLSISSNAPEYQRDTSNVVDLSPALKAIRAVGKPIGPDISRWDKVADWQKLSSSGIDFVLIKASEGIKQDSSFSGKWADAGSHGLIRGAYHYFTLHDGGLSDQAKNYASVVHLSKGDLPPILDLDTLENIRKISSALLKRIDTTLQLMSSDYGMQPIIFVHPAAARVLANNGYNKYLLWIGDQGTTPAIPVNWNAWVFWQFSTKESLPGIEKGRFKVNMDQFNGTLEQLKTLTKP
jgi:GH25 family lysozyme M1 (1,4-beta-N-acetylmuramidase)/cellulose biosynthesis protein BcsQ